MTEPVKPTNHRTGQRGRPSPLNDPEYAKLVAQAFVDGLSRAEMCETFGVKDPATITRWRRDPRIKAIVMKLIEDRVIAITRRVDGEIERRLQDADKMTVDELIKIRKEFLGGAARAQTEKGDEETVTQAMEAIEKNPELMEDLQKLLSGRSSTDEG